MSQSLKERNKARKRFGFHPLTEAEHTLDQKGLKQTYHNPDSRLFEFSPKPLSHAKTQLVSADT